MKEHTKTMAKEKISKMASDPSFLTDTVKDLLTDVLHVVCNASADNEIFMT